MVLPLISFPKNEEPDFLTLALQDIQELALHPRFLPVTP